MAKVIVTRSCRVQVLFAHFELINDAMNRLKRLNEFPDYQLTPEELGGTETSGWIVIDGNTMVRWKVGNMDVIIFLDGQRRLVMVDVMERLDSWCADDPRYQDHLEEMRRIVVSFAERTGLEECPVRQDDPSIKLRHETLKRVFGPLSWYQGDLKTAYCAVVVLQDLGADPFVETSEISLPGSR